MQTVGTAEGKHSSDNRRQARHGKAVGKRIPEARFRKKRGVVRKRQAAVAVQDRLKQNAAERIEQHSREREHHQGKHDLEFAALAPEEFIRKSGHDSHPAT